MNNRFKAVTLCLSSLEPPCNKGDPEFLIQIYSHIVNKAQKGQISKLLLGNKRK